MRVLFWIKGLACCFVVCCVILLGGCSSIWNASDLADWVRDEAVKQGCERDSIQLNEWYTAESTGNVWHGTCLERDSGERMTFAVNVDAVWTPSSGR